jgi:hypothetical protein
MFESEEVPPPTALERLGSALKAAAGGGWAGLTAEGLGQVVGSVFKTQVQTFVEGLAHRLKDLEKTQLTLEEILSNPKFLDAAFRAAIAAGTTHQEEKREALRNAVLNSALPGSPDEDRQQMFIAYIERLTASHLRVLRVVADGAPVFATGAWDHVSPDPKIEKSLEASDPDLAKDRDFAQQVCFDLQGLNLIALHGGGPVRLGHPLGRIIVYPLTKEFLQFVSSPP